MTTALLQSACRKGNALFGPADVILKGKEAVLPKGVSFQDKDGNVRTETRTRWYMSPQGQTCRTYALQSDELDWHGESLFPGLGVGRRLAGGELGRRGRVAAPSGSTTAR